MDSKFLRITLLVSLLFMVTIFLVVLYSNGIGPGQQKEQQEVLKSQTKEIILDGQIGNDLYGWMEDEAFFDKVYVKEVTEEGAMRVNLVASSIEKDMRVKIVNKEGDPVEGQFFKILLNDQDEYKDMDRDGIIYIADLDPGEYKVSMMEQEGFVVPKASMPVSVKAKVEYLAINDISLMIKTEEEVDSLAEDAKRKIATQGENEPTELRKIETAKLGIDVSRWNEEINWDKVKDAGVNYAIIRAGYRGSVTGALVEDWYFRKNAKEATEAGIPIGIYFFTQAINEVEAVEEASMVLALCEEYDIKYPIFIDTEGAGGDGRADQLTADKRTAICQAFCQTIKSAGYEAGIYASKNWFLNNIKTSILPDNLYIWLAEYGDAVTYDGKYHMWQYTSSGRVNGIEGRVDLNLSFVEPSLKKENQVEESNEKEESQKTNTSENKKEENSFQGKEKTPEKITTSDQNKKEDPGGVKKEDELSDEG